MGKKTVSVLAPSFLMPYRANSWYILFISTLMYPRRYLWYEAKVSSRTLISELSSRLLQGDMESLNPEFSLYGRKNKCCVTNTVFFPISQVCTWWVTLRRNTQRGLQVMFTALHTSIKISVKGGPVTYTLTLNKLHWHYLPLNNTYYHSLTLVNTHLHSLTLSNTY